MKFTTQEFNVVDSEEFSRAVTEHFSKRYDFQIAEGVDNDTDHIFTADVIALGVWDWIKYDLVIPTPSALLGALHLAGKIPAGRYIIRVRN